VTGTVLVTGSSGFIGERIVAAFREAGRECVGVDIQWPFNGQSLTDFHRCDLRDGNAVDRVMSSVAPTIVCHAAGQVNVRKAIAQPRDDFSLNVHTGFEVLRSATHVGARVVLLSSGAVYGVASTIPTPEGAALVPISPLGAAKASIEMYARAFGFCSGCPPVILRAANVYGPRQSPANGLVAMLLDRVLSGEVVTLYGGGAQTRDFVFVDDVATACRAAALSHPGGTLNVGSGTETRVYDVVRMLGEIAGEPVRVHYASAQLGEVLRSCLDCRRAATELGWTPAIDIKAGLRKTFDGLVELHTRTDSAARRT
jgi:UDP-glucose 4-epimerase